MCWPLETSITSVYWALGSLTLLMTWSLPTSCHKKAGLWLFYTFVLPCLCWTKEQLFLYLMRSKWTVLGTQYWGVTFVDRATSYGSNQVEVKLMLEADNVFVKNPAKPLGTSCVPLPARTFLLAEPATGSTIRCMRFCLFISCIPAIRSASYAIKEYFYREAAFGFNTFIRLQPEC